jgi:hypothetical protein
LFSSAAFDAELWGVTGYAQYKGLSDAGASDVPGVCAPAEDTNNKARAAQVTVPITF